MLASMERRFGRYTVLSTLGSGAMGEVFRAKDERLGREVAIKTLRNVAGLSTDSFRSRFDAEARALAALSHPAVVHVHDLGIEGDQPYLVMELVDGPSLKALLAKGPRSAAEVRAMGIQIARGLEAAHARQILHRDLKPANILRAANGQWKLADFGIARVPDSDITITGQFLGTPAYAAPESLLHGGFSDRSDVFGLAATMVEALTGVRLRGTGTMTEVVQHSGDELVLPDGIPPDLARALRLALSRDPAARPTAARLAEMLAAAGHPAAARRLPRAIAAIAGTLLAVGVVAAIVAAGGRDEPRGEPIDAAAQTPIDAAPEIDAEPEPELPPITPGRIQVIYPPGLDRRAYQKFSRVVDKVREGRLDDALDALDEFEREHEETPQTRHLRAQIEAAGFHGRDDD